MKKIIVAAMASGLLASIASAGTSVSMDVASAYVFRGQTLVDDLVVQPGIEVDGFGLKEECGSIAVGVWGSTAPFEDTYNNFHETDWYVVYTLPELVTNLNLSIGFTEYMYVVPAGEQEINLCASYLVNSNVTVGSSLNFMVDTENDLTKGQVYFDLYADYAVEVSDKMDASAGALISLMKQGDGNDALGLNDGFNHYEFNAGFTYAINDTLSLGASLAYIGQLDSDVLPNAVYDRGLVGMFSIGADM